MRSFKTAGVAIAAVIALTPFAYAQTPAQDINATQTYTGCLMKETDYRRAHNLGGGTAGGVGLGDEFVLVDVKVSAALPATETTKSSGSATISSSTSASPCADQGLAYRVTGTAEEKIKGLVGHQIEIQGRFKHAADAAAGGTRPDEKLPAEIEIVSFRLAPSPVTMSTPVASVASSTSSMSSTSSTPVSAQSSTVSGTSTPVNPPATQPREELPRTASSTTLLALIGVLALSTGLALTARRRRAV